MSKLVEFASEGSDTRVVVEMTEEEQRGSRPVSRSGPGRLSEATHTFEESLAGARRAAEAALRVFRDGQLKPDSVDIEFGVKLTAETGAVLVKGSAEGHLVVKLSWSPKAAGAADGS